jgi:hypothetical protein
MGIIFAIGCKSPFQERLLLARQSQLTPSRFYTIEFTSPVNGFTACVKVCRQFSRISLRICSFRVSVASWLEQVPEMKPMRRLPDNEENWRSLYWLLGAGFLLLLGIGNLLYSPDAATPELALASFTGSEHCSACCCCECHKAGR